MVNYQFRNIIFEGGGVKGLAYAGAMQELEKRKILKNISRAGGTSAGAINAVLFCAGYTVKETVSELKKLDFNKFKDDSFGMLRDLNRLNREYGWHKGNYFRNWIGRLLENKVGSEDVNFKQLREHTGKELFVYATNLSTGFGEVYSHEKTPNVRVTDAVRRSMSIPLFFRAIRDDRNDVFVDGGMLNNFPVKLFDREKYLFNKKLADRIPKYYREENKTFLRSHPNSSPYVFNTETLGFRLDTSKEIGMFRDGQEPQHHRIDSFLDYAVRMVKSLISFQDNQHLHSDDWHRTIYIDSLDVDTTEFDLSEDQKKRLIKSGKDATSNYFDWWDDTKNDVAMNHPKSTRYTKKDPNN